MYEVPTGWKFFGNLMDAGKLSICGEESFGQSDRSLEEPGFILVSKFWCLILFVDELSGVEEGCCCFEE